MRSSRRRINTWHTDTFDPPKTSTRVNREECGGSRAEVPLLAARPCGSHTSWTTHRKKGLIHPNSQGGSTAHELFETNSMPAHSPQPTTSPLPPNPSYQLHFPLLHLNNNHTYTRNDERYCSFCLPLPRIVNEPFFTAPTPLHSLNQQFKVPHSIYDDTISGRGQPT